MATPPGYLLFLLAVNDQPFGRELGHWPTLDTVSILYFACYRHVIPNANTVLPYSLGAIFCWLLLTRKCVARYYILSTPLAISVKNYD